MMEEMEEARSCGEVGDEALRITALKNCVSDG